MTIFEQTRRNQASPLTRPDDKGNSGTALWFNRNEVRSFSQIMLDWQLSHKNASAQDFLKQTSLDNLLTNEQWNLLCVGELTPDNQLGHLLIAAMFADPVYQENGPYEHRSSYSGARHSLERQQGNIKKDVMQISEVSIAEAKQRIAKTIYDRILNAASCEESETENSAKSAFEMQLATALQARSHAREYQPEEDMEALKSYCKREPAVAKAALLSLLPQTPEAEVQQWMEEQTTTKVKPHPGLLLKFMRQSAGLYHHDLAELTGIGYGLIGRLERADIKISGTLLKRLVSSSVFASELNSMLEYARFPALDNTWLTNQPIDLQPILWLKAQRNRTGLNREQFAQKFGLDKSAARRIEGKEPTSDYFIKYCKAVQKYFINERQEELVFPPCFAEKLAAPYQAFDPQWQQAQTPDAAYHALLIGCRKRLSLTTKFMGAQLGVSESRYAQMQTYDEPHLQRLEKIITVFDAEAKQQPAFMGSWFNDTVKNKLRETASAALRTKKPFLPDPDVPPQGELLRTIRIKLGLTQQGLARLADAGKNYISKLENGKNVCPKTLDKVMHAMRIADANLPPEERFFDVKFEAMVRKQCDTRSKTLLKKITVAVGVVAPVKLFPELATEPAIGTNCRIATPPYF